MFLLTDFRADLLSYQTVLTQHLFSGNYPEKYWLGDTVTGIASTQQKPHYGNHEDLWEGNNCYASLSGQREKCDITWSFEISDRNSLQAGQFLIMELFGGLHRHWWALTDSEIVLYSNNIYKDANLRASW